tara:strand:+ start:1601 stop:3940 length:2340 start_codon:yes stop_codon:yes gene_type:complete
MKKNVKYLVYWKFDMSSFKNYLIYSLSFFSLFSFAQSFDPALLSELSEEQLEVVEGYMQGTAITESNNEVPVEDETEESLVDEDIEEIEEIDELPEEPDLLKYGYDFFSKMPTSLSAVGDLPFPNDYKISLRDQFEVILTGSKDQRFDLEVNLDGTILFPELGSVYLVGLTFQEAKDKLTNMINQSYIGVNIDISLKNLSAKKVTIVGAVNTPGTYLVNPFSSITGALAYSGGILEIGSLRDIKLIRNNGTVFSFDLYDLLIRGDRSNDLTIEAGDTILINAASQFVEIKGSVNRPAIYEILEGEKIKDLIDFALGFTQTANKSNISISYLDFDKASIVTKTKARLDNNLKNAFSVDIFSYVSKEYFAINVSGAVGEPGFYDLEKYNNLSDLIEDLTFVEVYPWLAVLEQFDDDNLVKSTVLFSLNDKSTYQSIKLLPNAKIYFANIDERNFDDVSDLASALISEYSLRINYKDEFFELPVIGEYTVKSFVDLLGIDMSDINNEATYISPLDSVIINNDYRKMNFVAKKYNNVSFRAPINDLINISISGAINYPGQYTLKSDSTLEDLYKLVGDFKKEAFLDGVILTRENVRERQLKAINDAEANLNKSLMMAVQQGEDVGDITLLSSLAQSIEPQNLGRVAGNFSPLSPSVSETVLFDGDQIIIPKITNVINVIGEVLNPIAFEYAERMSIDSAISRAGGYESSADKKRVYVIKANGMVEKTGRNIFAGNSNLEPGDTIVVPRKLEVTNTILRTLTPITQILSDLAFSAAAIDNLSNN